MKLAKLLLAPLVVIPATAVAHPGHEHVAGAAHHFLVEGLAVASLAIAALGLVLFLRNRRSP